MKVGHTAPPSGGEPGGGHTGTRRKIGWPAVRGK